MSNGKEDGRSLPVAPRAPSEIADASTTAHLRQLVAGGKADVLQLKKIMRGEGRLLAGASSAVQIFGKQPALRPCCEGRVCGYLFSGGLGFLWDTATSKSDNSARPILFRWSPVPSRSMLVGHSPERTRSMPRPLCRVPGARLVIPGRTLSPLCCFPRQFSRDYSCRSPRTIATPSKCGLGIHANRCGSFGPTKLWRTHAFRRPGSRRR